MNKKNPIEINFIFFGLLLIIGIVIATLEVLEINQTSLYSKTFFLIYAYVQTVLEILGFALIVWLIKKKLKKIFFYSFIGLFFTFFLTHIIDYFVLKIVDMTFWEGLDIALDENLENFLEMLHTTGVPLFVWAIIGLIILFLPLTGIGFYKICDKISKKRKLFLCKEQIVQIFFCIPLAIFIWDFKASSSINSNVYSAYTRALPWKLTFSHPPIMEIDTPLTLKKPQKEAEILKIIHQKNLKIKKKPNIFIFVIESLRNDYITKNISPNLYEFKQNNLNFDISLSNANATHQSWFSLFYSDFPFFWKYYQDNNWQIGATGLYILKKIGYKINVFSAPELKYYSMNNLLFGKDNYLVDTLKLHPHYHPIQACDSDAMVIKDIQNQLEKDSNVYIAFLDSTHFLYSWPKDFEAKFTNNLEGENLKVYSSKNHIDLLKNRYKNSINFIDFLLGSFFETLKKNNLFNDSLIVILADHGEEFYEEGRIFHASHLSSVQTNIPILLKLSNSTRKIPERKLICHMDVFPSILDHLFKKNQFKDIFLGESIFDTPKLNFVITTRYNASRMPYEFFIHNENEKLTLKFKKEKNILKKQHLKILSLKDKNDKKLNISSKEALLKSFKSAFDKLFYKK